MDSRFPLRKRYSGNDGASR